MQELIIQNFQPKQGTAMAAAPEPAMEELLWTIAVARIMFGPQMNIQAPPNLTPGGDSSPESIICGSRMRAAQGAQKPTAVGLLHLGCVGYGRTKSLQAAEFGILVAQPACAHVQQHDGGNGQASKQGLTASTTKEVLAWG